MGGQAFSSRPLPLNVIRLSPKQYIELRDQYQEKLLEHYEKVCTPPEAPQKADHGDIDVLVNIQRYHFTRDHLARVLGARDHLQIGSTSSFAIPMLGSHNNSEFFQLDVHVCKPGFFEWEKTIYTHGDLWRILGIAANRMGFAINNTGLHLRIAEIDQTHPKDSLLRLTHEPTEIMDFLGLDADRFQTGFDDLDQIFSWATSSRFFRRRWFEKKQPKTQEAKAERPMFLAFVTKWLPQHPEVGVRDHHTSHKSLTEEALEKYNKREEYQLMVERHRKRLLKDAMWRKIAKALPLEGKELGKAMIALKANLRWRDGTPGLFVDDQTVDRVPALDERTVDAVVLPWVLEHWRQAVDLVDEGERAPGAESTRST